MRRQAVSTPRPRSTRNSRPTPRSVSTTSKVRSKVNANYNLKYSKPPGILWSLDTETTGTDFYHGCKPFLYSACSTDGDVLTWEWDVNPLTREPIIPNSEEKELGKFLNSNHFVLHNTKFDYRAGESIGLPIPSWEHTQDTHLASHTLASAASHKLKDLALQHLDINDDDQKDLQEAVNAARRFGRKMKWRIASEGDPHFPAWKPKQNEGWWVADMWLPRAVAKYCNYPKDHPWWTVCRKYNIQDVERTIGLWLLMKEAMEEEGLYHLYERRRLLLPITYKMESRGMTFSSQKLEPVQQDFHQRCTKAKQTCLKLAGPGHTEKSLNSPGQLRSILFDKYKLPPGKKTKSGQNFSTDKEVLNDLVHKAAPGSAALRFLENLLDARGYETALSYMESYEKFACRANKIRWWELHPGFNISGTATTRFSSSNPNAQNISKKEKANLRQIFGPMPGREWWAMDYSNIEMRIFAYESGDKRLIEAFESGFSVHLIFAEVLHPKEYAECLKTGEEFKDKYESTLYQWVKNGNFALIYGAGVKKANATYHVDGAYDIIRKKLPLIDKFMRAKDEEARKKGYITTLGGYRLQVPEKKPHCAVNYFVQGTAGWCMINAMIRVAEYLQTLKDHHLIMTIHDELDYDFPTAAGTKNLSYAYHCKKLMELSGNDIGIPTPVDVERHPDNWAKGERIKDWSLAA